MRGLVAAALVCTLSGCATLLREGAASQLEVEVAGPARGVEITVKAESLADEQHDQGPSARFWLSRMSSYAVLATADGYRPAVAATRLKPTLGFWLDFVPVAGVFVLSAAQVPTFTTDTILGATVLTLGFLGIDSLTQSLYEHHVRLLKLELQPQ